MNFNIIQQEGIQLVGKLVQSTISVDYTAMFGSRNYFKNRNVNI